MYARYNQERDVYTVEWNGLHADSIEDRVLMVIAHAMKSAYDTVTMAYSKDKTIVTLMAYDAMGQVVAHLDMKVERSVQ